MPKRGSQKRHRGKRKKGGKRKGKKKSKMPANVVAYFNYRNAGMSKTAAKKKAGL
jgi:hypothetical protein